MRLESAIYISRAGLDTHGKAISVIGDNVSNANTTGYKSSRTEFSDLLSAGTATPDNPTSESYSGGVQLQRVRQLHQEGSVEFTGRQLDAAITGNGFFLVGDPAAPLLTRAGNFEVDDEGNLVTANGLAVLGTAADGTGFGVINVANVNATGAATSALQMTGNLNSAEDITTVPATVASFRDLNDANFVATATVFDSLGASHEISLYFFKTENAKWTVQAYTDGAETGGVAGTPVKLGETTLTFNETGALAEGTAASLTAQGTFAGAAQSNIAIDLTGFSQFATGSVQQGVTQDGNSAGSVTGYAIQPTGEVFVTLSSGVQVSAGIIQLGGVTNLDGLKRIGDTLYQWTGDPAKVVKGAPGTGILGTIEGGSLELSNVDLSTEFVNMILYQRGYQASSQVLNTAAQMVRDALALIR